MPQVSDLSVPARRDPGLDERSPPAGQGHAIVIGASLAGLLAARVLRDHFPRVTLIERDRLPEAVEPRPGVPHGQHGHALLSRGYRILCQLFPDLDRQLELQGAPAGDATADTAILYRRGWVPSYRSGIRSRGCSRLLLEQLIRRSVLAMKGVEVIARGRVTGLELDKLGRTVTGVQIEPADHSGKPATLPGELVVDASGRFSRLPDWLERLGLAPPRETVVDSHFGYATRRYRKPGSHQERWQVLVVYGLPPDLPRCGMIYPEENNQWVVTMVGGMGDYPPTDEAGFLEFARSLASPLLYESIRDAEPLSEVGGYRQLANRMRHYEALPGWPEQLVVLGDAACTFNPVHAQGMSVCASSAELLGKTVGEWRRRSRGWTGLARSFQCRLARQLATPWLLATSEESRFVGPEVHRSMASRLMHWYLDQALLQVKNSRFLTQSLAQVMHLESHPMILLHPRIIARVGYQAALWFLRPGAFSEPVREESGSDAKSRSLRRDLGSDPLPGRFPDRLSANGQEARP